MSSTFIRGYYSMPSLEEITKIEGVIVVEGEISGGPGGTPSNYLCCVGEFADMTQCLQVDNTGLVSTLFRPQYALSAADLEDKFGGFDSSIGQFGNAMGNGWVELSGKVVGTGRLLCLPVNLCSLYAGRMFRQLPTNNSATDANPIVPLVAAQVPAGYEFKTGANRLHTGIRDGFTADAYFANGTDGTATSTSSAATQIFGSATGDFTGATVAGRKVYPGDLLVLGVLGAAGALGANADTLRVVSVTSAVVIVVEKLDGSNFDWTTGTALPWRIHPGASGDTGGRTGTSTTPGFALAAAAGYNVPARPLDATIAAATAVSPTVPPPTPSANLWDALSGLKFRTHPTQPLTYTAAIQAPNAANSSSIDALYQAALNGLLGDKSPASLIGGILCARKSATIALATKQHCLTSFAGGHPRVCFVAPPVNTLTYSAVIASTYPGVEALRDPTLFYYWPAVRTLPIIQAVGVSIATSDGQTTVDGSLDVTMDGYAAALFTRLAPERSPGQASEPVPSTFVTILDYARGVPAPDIGVYQLLKSRGISGVKIDTPPAQIQSAVNSRLPTTPADPRCNQNKVVFTHYVMRSLASMATVYSKELGTDDLRDGLKTAVNGFLNSLGPRGPNMVTTVNPQRIADASQTDITTPDEADLGIIKLDVAIKMLSTLDFILFRVTAGTTVKIELVGAGA